MIASDITGSNTFSTAYELILINRAKHNSPKLTVYLACLLLRIHCKILWKDTEDFRQRVDVYLIYYVTFLPDSGRFSSSPE